MDEPKSNVILLCPECSTQAHKLWQLNNQGTKIGPGDFIKTAITDGKRKEHMWFQVLSVSNDNPDKFWCKLVNQPFYVENVLYGDEVEILFTNIEDYKPENYASH